MSDSERITIPEDGTCYITGGRAVKIPTTVSEGIGVAGESLYPGLILWQDVDGTVKSCRWGQTYKSGEIIGKCLSTVDRGDLVRYDTTPYADTYTMVRFEPAPE